LRLSFFQSKASSGSGQFNALFRVLLLGLFAQVAVPAVNAQTPPAEARVTSVSGGAIRSNNLSPSQPVQRGDVLEPGDEIDTRGGGHVILELTDGSVVIVQPGSRIQFQDYRVAGSLYKLFEILVGRVHFKINHFVGRPNPYRVNSPTASIAVRGTEFSVAVQGTGATEVTVYAGLVEVASLKDPGQTVIVGPGDSVIVRPNAEILFFMAGDQEHGRDMHRDGRRDATDAAVFYEQYSNSLIESAETSAPARFAAFSDPHLDSIDNPAYATEFSTVDGRLLLLPSMSGAPPVDTSGAVSGSIPAVPANYSFSPQGSFFVPLPQTHTVVGGSFTATNGGLQSLSLSAQNAHSESPLGVTSVSGSTDTTYFTGSLIAAHAFGSSQRTSLGLAFVQTWAHGSLINAMAQTDQTGGVTRRKQLDSSSSVRVSEIDAGLTHAFFGGHKLGVVYRYGILSADEADSLYTRPTVQPAPDSTLNSSSSSELDVRLRGPITRRLFYGLEAGLLFAHQDEKELPAKGVRVSGLELSKRVVASAGLGYAPSRRILLAIDISGGSSWTRNRQSYSDTGNLMKLSLDPMHFLSTHVAVQTDIWRRMFASASMLSLTQTSQSQLMAGSTEPPPTSVGHDFSNRISRDHFTDYFSDFGIGWRFSSHFLAQYIYSTDYGLTPPRHTLMLRYSFRSGRE
jgi:FecR-like protein